MASGVNRELEAFFRLVRGLPEAKNGAIWLHTSPNWHQIKASTGVHFDGRVYYSNELNPCAFLSFLLCGLKKRDPREVNKNYTISSC